MAFNLIYIGIMSGIFGFWQHSVLATIVMAGLWVYVEAALTR